MGAVIRKALTVWENDAAPGMFFAQWHWPPSEFLHQISLEYGADLIEGVESDEVECIYLVSKGEEGEDETFEQCPSSAPGAQPYTMLDLS